MKGPALQFRHLDLNLLRVLCAIHRSGSVTEAGRQLALSQPATSNALARLRRHFDDALYVRSPTGLHPTPLAQRVAPQVEAHLRALEEALAPQAPFEPASGQVDWRLSLSDLGEVMFLPPLAGVLRREAPACRIANVAVDAARVSAALEAREIDLAIGIGLPEHRGITGETLFHEQYVAIADRHWRPPGAPVRGGSGAGRSSLSQEQLAQARLAIAAPTATSHQDVESMLARLKPAGPPTVRARHYAALPELVTRTDLLAIVPEMFAASLAPRYALTVWALPGRGVPYEVRMLWHGSAGGDTAHAWLRGQVRALFGRR